MMRIFEAKKNSADQFEGGTENQLSANVRQAIAYSPLSQKNYQSLLLATFLVLLPHFYYLPIAQTALMLLVLAFWQWQIFKHGTIVQTQKGLSAKLLQYAVVITGLVIIFAQYHTFVGVDAGCAALALILLGKGYELKNYRDGIIHFNFALFVAAAAFLYGQGIFTTIAVLIAIFQCFYGMYQLQSYHSAYEEVLVQDVSVKQLRQHAFKTVLKLLGFAAPIMVMLFLFFPRFPPLWSMPSNNKQATTGVSDSMTPGDIANLSQSNALAFRVVFDDPNQMPTPSNLYWRAMVLDDYDGTTWTPSRMTRYNYGLLPERGQSTWQIPNWYQVPNGQSARLANYQLILEPTFQRWVYSLDHSVSQFPLRMKPDLSIQSFGEIARREQFDLAYIIPKPRANIVLDDLTRQYSLALPEGRNTQTLAFAQQLFQQQGNDPKRYANAVLSWIRTNNFSYTLSPPLLGEERIDDFLFRTRSGFCEHYASAYTNLMRMVGIPARVVVGYQGGKSAPDGASWEVRQLDAHAWTEVWFAGEGWVRIDPTAAIAPDRVNLGMQDYANQNDTVFDDSALSNWSGSSNLLMQARIWMDYASYQWQSKVVGFDQGTQRDWLKKFSIDNLSEQLIVLIVTLITVIGLVVWWLSRQQKIKRSKLDQAIENLSKRLQKIGLNRQLNEPVLTWLQRIQLDNQANQRLLAQQQLDEIIQRYTQHQYIAKLSDAQLHELIQLLAKYTITPKS